MLRNWINIVIESIGLEAIAGRLEASADSLVGWRASLVGWRPSLVGWRASLVGWRPSLVGWRPLKERSARASEWSMASQSIDSCGCARKMW